MAGVILENLGRRSLIIFFCVLVVIQISVFLIGGLYAPSPSYVHQVLTIKCIDERKGIHPHLHKKHWFIPRGKKPIACDHIESFDDPRAKDPNAVVFAAIFPLPRDGHELTMDPLFQSLVSTLQVDILYDKDNYIKSSKPQLEIDARLGYRDEGEAEDQWHEIARSTELRNLDCSIDNDQREDGNMYNCALLPLFELGSTFHDFYILNMRIPVKHHAYALDKPNVGIGKIVDIWVYGIHQNGGFTLVWFSLKTVFFPVLLVALVWFWRRVVQLDRKPNLLEKTLFSLGLAISFLNLPVDWLTLSIDMPFFVLFQDIRQGLFYSFLLCFWMIFLGEHLMDQQERNRLVVYWKHMAAVGFGCICLFVFEICERGVQLMNPFYSIWATDTSSKLGLAFIILAGIAAGIYFLFLCYMLVKVMWNIRSKKMSMSHMSSMRRKFYMGLIYRFYFMLVVTVICAALTVVFFIIVQVSEGAGKWGDEQVDLQYTSAFLTGVYAMWNLYVFALLILYAPSRKVNQSDSDGADESLNETREGTSQIATETMALADFARKAAAD